MTTYNEITESRIVEMLAYPKGFEFSAPPQEKSCNW